MVAVHVLIDLQWQTKISGHVKSWIQFAQIATSFPSKILDLTLHFQGKSSEEIILSPNVRYIVHPPKFSTEKLPFLQDVPSHTDLFPYASRLIPYLAQSDIIHTTHSLLSFGQTAEKFCHRTGKPLVTSLHTDTPFYSQIYLEQKIKKICGDSILGHFFNHTLRLPEKYKINLQNKQHRHWQACQHIWYGQPSEKQELDKFAPHIPHSRLRRGIDRQMFNPQKRDRTLLHKLYGIPTDSFLLLFVGRLDACKNVMTFIKTINILLKRQIPVHGIAVGKGSQEAEIQKLLPEHISLLGALDQKQLGLIYASADLFVFPSETEITPNVLIEAKASGLVPCVSAQGGASQLIQTSGEDGLIIARQNPEDWADQIQVLWQNRLTLENMKILAYNHVKQNWPTWETVFREDLLPVWTSIAQLSSPSLVRSK